VTLGKKLLLAQAPLIAALVILGLTAAATVSRLGKHSQVILADNYRSILAAERMKDALERIDSGALFILNGRRDEGAAMAASSRPLFASELDVELHNITEPGEAEAADALRAGWLDYAGRFDAFLALTEPDKAAAAYFGELLPMFYTVKKQAQVILDMNQEAMVQKSEQVRIYSRRMDTFMLAVTFAAVMGGLLASAALLSRMLRPLTVLSSAARCIGEGDFAIRAQVESDDEIGLLAREFNSMAQGLERYRKSSLGELLLAQHTAQAVIDSLPDPILSFDLEGTLVSVNLAAEDSLGVSPGAAHVTPLAGLDPALRLAVNRATSHVLAGKGAYLPAGFEEAVHIAAGAAEGYYLPMASPVFGELGSLAGVTIVLRDVGMLRKLDEMSVDLVATFAHEFRTPLTSLHMAIHVCLEKMTGPLTEKQSDVLSAAREECERLQRMISDLLDIARLQSGRVPMQARSVDPRALIGMVIEKHRLLAEKAGLTLSSQVWPECGSLSADPDRLDLLLSNLVTNAISHTPKGGSVSVEVKRQDGGTRFEVRDTGEGIPREYLAKVFEKFFRVPGQTSGGSGLGLSIAKNIAEALGGVIGVDSEQGKGSVFWFVIPPAAPGGEAQ
jgi:signal transduction histidine kinase/HAMP domain-containing protein